MLYQTGTSGIKTLMQIGFPEVGNTGLYYYITFFPSNLVICRGPFEDSYSMHENMETDKERWLNG